MPSEPAVRMRGLRKTYGDVDAVAGVDLDVADGEFFSLLGPSGSGKTTLLRLTAGFELPTSGTVTLAGRDVSTLAPFERDVHTVFQDYALFPHMTVRDNVAYALRVAGVGRRERTERAREALATVRLPDHGDRMPSQLSGGQRQRVALARALVDRPKVLLLDEPLGALDLKLRRELQGELTALQREVGVTFVFVTHDQEEALSMSDRVAVVNEGRIEQVGTPSEIYESPVSAFVADFVGVTNLLAGDDAVRVLGTEGTFSVRPERIRISADAPPAGTGRTTATGRVRDVVFTGPSVRVAVALDDGPELVVVRPNDGAGDRVPAAGERAHLCWATEHAARVAGRSDRARPEETSP